MLKKLLKIDSRRRVALPNAAPGDVFKLRVLDNGQIELTPFCAIDKNKIEELWKELDSKLEVNIPTKEALYKKLGL